MFSSSPLNSYGVAKFGQLAGEIAAVDVEFLQLFENRLGLMLFVQSLVDELTQQVTDRR